MNCGMTMSSHAIAGEVIFAKQKSEGVAERLRGKKLFAYIKFFKRAGLRADPHPLRYRFGTSPAGAWED